MRGVPILQKREKREGRLHPFTFAHDGSMVANDDGSGGSITILFRPRLLQYIAADHVNSINSLGFAAIRDFLRVLKISCFGRSGDR